MIRYVTRWALTTGIIERDGSYTDDGKYFTRGALFVSAKEAFATLDEAHAEARRMADRKVASLKRQVAKLSDPAWRAKVVER